MIYHILTFLAGSLITSYPAYKIGKNYGLKISSVIAKAEEEAYKIQALFK